MTLTLDSEPLKYAYNHPGLAATYTIENIDVRTIRRLNETSQIQVKPEFKQAPFFKHPQLEFDFGEEFRNWMQPLVLEEPIQVLQLSSQAEKILNAYQKTTLKNLLELSNQNFIFDRGMGQGHIDEIKQKFHSYLEKHSYQQSQQIDFSSIIRILMGPLPRKHLSIFLEKFKLNDLCPLSPAESMEIKRLMASERLIVEQRMQIELCSSHNKAFITRILNEIVNVLIKPWMQKRQGLATQDELIERLQRCSREPSLLSFFIDFISLNFFNSKFILMPFLSQLSHTLYSANNHIKSDYEKITLKALTYFYKKNVYYPLKEIIYLLQKEFVQAWDNFSEEFICKVLTLNDYFRVRKESCGRLIVRLA